jgi:virulence factor Mce-like protein
MERKLWTDVALGAFILAALGVLAYMAIAVGGLKVGRAIVVSAKFDNAAGLVKDSAVLIAGVNVGSVESLSVAHDKALVKLRLKTDAQIRQDVRAAIRMKSLLGEKYVELLPQSETASLLRDGDTIGQTTVPVEVDEVMKQIGPVLKDVDPRDVASVMHSLALTLRGREDRFGTTMDKAAETLTTLDRMLTANEGKIDHLVSSLDRAADAVPGLAGRLDHMTADLEPTSKAIAAHAPGLIARLDRSSEALDPAVRALAKNGPDLIAKTDRTLDGLQPSLERLPSTLDALTPSLARLPRLLDRLDKVTTKLDGTLASLEPLLEQTRGRDVFDRDGSLKVKAKLF